MSFADTFPAVLQNPHSVLRRFERLLAPKSSAELEEMAQASQALTRKFFGRTMRLFAPLYLSNECVNICKYCGFSRDNPIVRATLTVDQVEAEARYLVAQGFRSILLVAGEHPKFVSDQYLMRCVERLHPFVPSVSLEVGPLETDRYRPLVQAGAEGLVVYQETYQPEIYAELHPAGPKKDFAWRLACPERADAAGFKRLGIAALFGLAPWRDEALALAAHADYLLKHCWKAALTISLPRLRPAAGEFQLRFPFSDRDLTQLLCALRLCFPQVGLVLSTREPAALRDRLIPLGITLMSAGSHTEPGGYTGAGHDQLHQTVKGQTIPLLQSKGGHSIATEQFHIADERTPAQVAQRLRELGYEPVWKDWDQGLLAPL